MRLFALLALCLLSSGLRADKLLDQAVADLRYGKSEAREAAAQALAVSNNPKAEKALLEALSDSSGTLKLRILQALGFAGGKDALTALDGQLKDPASEVRSEAARALGRIGDPSAGAALGALLADPDSEVKAEGIKALGLCGAKDLAPKVKTALKDKNRLVRFAAIGALSRLGAKPYLPELMKELKDPDALYRRQVVKAIASVDDDKKTHPLLVGWLSDKDATLRGFSAEALMAQAPFDAGRAPLRKLLADPVLAVRVRAIETLGAWQDTASVPAVKKLLRDGEPLLRWKAAQALGRIGDPSALEALKYAAENDAEVEIRSAAAAALERINGKR